MSSRALRKLQQEKDAKELQLGGSDDEVSIVRPVTGARARRPNPFDLVSFSKLDLREWKNLSNDSNMPCLKLLKLVFFGKSEFEFWHVEKT